MFDNYGRQIMSDPGCEILGHDLPSYACPTTAVWVIDFEGADQASGTIGNGYIVVDANDPKGRAGGIGVVGWGQY
jgi:hypothetical protein